MSIKYIANVLSKAQRDSLIAHIDHPQPVNCRGPEFVTKLSLLERRLLRGEHPDMTRPQYTRLTELGREVVCAILGDYADKLSQVSLTVSDELVRLADIQAARSSMARAGASTRSDPLARHILSRIVAQNKSDLLFR
jgi:hypothetical protein